MEQSKQSKTKKWPTYIAMGAFIVTAAHNFVTHAYTQAVDELFVVVLFWMLLRQSQLTDTALALADEATVGWGEAVELLKKGYFATNSHQSVPASVVVVDGNNTNHNPDTVRTERAPDEPS